MKLAQATKGARLGHVHLKVSHLERSIAFYRDVLGLQLTSRYGDQAAFLSYGGYHHHLGLNTWESEGASPPPKYATGLYHFALLYPTREALASVVKNVLESGCELEGASDHGVSQAVYFRDPDHNGLELYWDRPPEDWPRNADGEIAMVTESLDLQALLTLALR